MGVASPPPAVAEPHHQAPLPFPLLPPSPPKPSPPAIFVPPSSLPAVYREWRVLPIATLTSIATVIGSGILALPVTLYQTSVPVFLLLFTASMLAQVAVVYAIVELLQRAREAATLEATAPIAPHNEEPGSPSSYESISAHENDGRHVSLFAIADLFLPNKPVRYLYFATTFLCFISMMVSYGLAGPQAVWQLISAGPQPLAPPQYIFIAYWTIGTAAVVFFVDQLLGVFGSFTVLKGALFIGVVVIVALLPDTARVASLRSLFADFSGWSAAAAPFLMTCVALGGLANTTPVTFSLLPVKANRAQVGRYRAAILVAVVVCYLLNVGWVLAVLQVVPRVADPGKASLTVAYEQGQISTVPLIDVLHNGNAVKGGVLKAVEVIVEMFIFVSTGVSFFVTAAGMKSFVDGATAVVPAKFPAFNRGILSKLPQVLAYLVSFGSVLTIIVTNPDGFISVLTRFASFTLNLQAGALLFLMLYNSRKIAGLFGRIGDSSDGESSLEAPVASLETWECSDEEDPNCQLGRTDGVPLVMSNFQAWTFIVLGSIFFSLACALVVLGPMLGIKLDAPRE